MKKFFGVLVWAGAVFVACGQVSITNIVVSQRPGTKLVDIAYDLLGDTTNFSYIGIIVDDGLVSRQELNLTGDAGENIYTGLEKKIVWNAEVSRSGVNGAVDFILTADDGQGFASGAFQIPQTGQTNEYFYGDDGTYQHGAAWPIPRFTNNENGTAIDNLTGLEWIISPSNLPGYSEVSNWDEAIDFCNVLTFAEHSDWRLPNIRELESLVFIGKGSWGDTPYEWLNSQKTPFSGIQNSTYFSSTTYSANTTYCYFINMFGGFAGGGRKSQSNNFIPVRGASTNGAIHLPKTGQTDSYRSGDDGDLEKGTAWAEPRFVENSDGTVRDKFTGLLWVKNTDAILGAMNWTNAINACEELVFAGRDHWRLPTKNELLSLIDYSQSSPALPQGHPFSDGNVDCWTSSSINSGFSNYAYRVAPVSGGIHGNEKKYSYSVWPVCEGVIVTSGVASATVDFRDYSFSISTAFGSPVPTAGTYSNYCWRSSEDCTITAAIETNEEYFVCSGWIGIGTSPASGIGNRTGEIILTNPVSSVVWNWVSAPPDSDDDGMKDVWESDNFGTLSAEAVADEDQDGQNNLHEYMFGSIPTNAASRFDFVGTPSQYGGYQLNFPTIQNRFYTVAYRNSLSSGGWTPFAGFLGNGTPALIIDSVSLSNRFYRVSVREE